MDAFRYGSLCGGYHAVRPRLGEHEIDPPQQVGHGVVSILLLRMEGVPHALGLEENSQAEGFRVVLFPSRSHLVEFISRWVVVVQYEL